MDLNTPISPFVDTPPTARLPGPDVVRAVALIGVMVMNYHGYLILRGLDSGANRPRTGWLEELFDPWEGPLATRFAATFVLVAGVSVTLLTRRVIGDAAAVSEMRWRLIRRGVFLYVVGLLLDEIWPGNIIVYYGAMFVLAAAIFTWRTRWIITVGAVAAVSATSIRLWEFDRNLNGHSTEWLSQPSDDSIHRYVLDIVVNGTHPLLPWFTFLCVGIVLGRSFTTTWWRSAAIGTGIVLVASASIVASLPVDGLPAIALSINPYDRSVVYVASALGTALIAYGTIDWIAERFRSATDPLRRAGQLTLSLYLAHVLVFKLLVDWLDLVQPGGIGTALLFAAGFWLVAVVIGTMWQRRFGRGPAEYVYRAFGG